jgi:hypothetical protein
VTGKDQGSNDARKPVIATIFAEVSFARGAFITAAPAPLRIPRLKDIFRGFTVRMSPISTSTSRRKLEAVISQFLRIQLFDMILRATVIETQKVKMDL